MKNISFDNPYLLLLALPVLLLLIIPYVIAIRKENRSKSVVVSFVLHMLIVLLVALAAAGTVATTVMTETQVYVVADVSYSANRNLDRIDAYILELQDKLPPNSKVGVVCFAKDQVLLADVGEEIPSVKTANVDESATNISAALNYTAELFDDDVIKRILLITDGKETATDATADLIRAVDNLHTQHIYIDAIYLDDNLPDDVKEVQISGVDFTPSTYLNHSTTTNVMLRTNHDANAVITLYCNGEKMSSHAAALNQGYNVVNFDLFTREEGEYDYEVRVEAPEDTSQLNNVYSFTQSVTGKLNVLLISSREEDLARAQQLYGDNATIDAYINDPDVPCDIEVMCGYDEIILSEIDVRTLHNYTAFVESVDQAVSVFGKSLITMGDLLLQNKTDEVLRQLEDMLPVTYGNSDRDAKLYGIVIDISHSMFNSSRLMMAKQAAIQLLNLLEDDDYVTVIAFSGDVTVMQPPTKALNREDIAKAIHEVETAQGTFIGLGLRTAFELMLTQPQGQKQVMLITDGMTFSQENDTPADIAAEMLRASIHTSVIVTSCAMGKEPMMSVALAGNGAFHEVNSESEVNELMFTEIADDLTDTVIQKESPVIIRLPADPSVSGLQGLPTLKGYVYAKEKSGAVTVLHTEYETKSGETTPPVYTYWNYGNGKVSTFTGTLTGKWSEGWESGEGSSFFVNVVKTNVPKERKAEPYTLNVTYDGTYSDVEISPAVLNPYAKTYVTLTRPDGTEITEELIFDSQRYTYAFSTPDLGKYQVEVLYVYGEKSFSSGTSFHISYSPEYDSFTIFDAASLHEAIRNRGTVSEGAVPVIENDEREVETYTQSYAIPLLIAAVALFVVDIFIRKIKWKDIQSLFGHKS